MAVNRQSPSGKARAGRGVGEDSTNMPGQYPNEIFGMAVPQTSGAKGSPPAKSEPESVNQPGQYPTQDPFTGVTFTQPGGMNQPPGSAGRGADEGANLPSASVSPPGLFYASTEADHMMESVPARADNPYPPSQETVAVRSPRGTGAGSGSVAGPGHPNAGR